MKQVLLLLLALLGGSFASYGQATPAATAPTLTLPTDSASGKILYEAVVQAPGVSQAELYRRAREWFVSNFKAYKEVVGVEDPVGGEIAGTYHSLLTKVLTTYEVWRTLKVYVKDGRYRYELTDFGARDIKYDRQVYNINPKNPNNVRRFGLEVEKEAQHDISSLATAMASPTGTTAKGKNW
ncbi:DUF4468 domain-containing protein [Hymenobacter psoromatis]|uniref:DUF4468 domain-containing protein n=1 Tax=Hymenobacter psoromatis TaxID=1484116 RepID=UPI001CC07B19|nr:DUF4468 domain-containing protein [Hymenobacter psoromatis]